MKRLIRTTASLAAAVSLLISGNAAALSTAGAAASSSDQQARLTLIKTRGDQEISRRLTSLNKLSSVISGATKLTSTDKTSLSSEVSSEISGLTSLKAQLDSATTLADASTAAKSIISDYRVYALIVPKVWLIKTADDQQVVEGKLTALSAKLQTRLDSAKSSGKDTSSLQSTLDDLNTQVQAAQAISSGIETKVIGLQPSDYDSDHTILSGDKTQLQTAHQDNQKAYQDAKTIVSGLKNL